MSVQIEQIKQFFVNIDRADITENDEGLLSEGIIDSIDVMGLVAEIEKHYGKALPVELIDPINFESMEKIKDMLNQAKFCDEDHNI